MNVNYERQKRDRSAELKFNLNFNDAGIITPLSERLSKGLSETVRAVFVLSTPLEVLMFAEAGLKGLFEAVRAVFAVRTPVGVLVFVAQAGFEGESASEKSVGVLKSFWKDFAKVAGVSADIML